MMPFTSLKGFEDIEEEWRRLLPYCGTNTVFVTPNWQRVWWKEFGKGAELLLLGEKDGGCLQGLAALARRNGTITFVGNTEVCDYLDFVVPKGAEARFFRQLVELLAEWEWDSLLLTSIPQESPTLEHFPSLARERGFEVTMDREGVTPGVSLPRSWDEYLSTLSKKDRHELRRKLRRLESAGGVRFYACGSQSDLEQDMEDFLGLMRASGEEKSRFLTANKEKFFKAMAREMRSLGVLKLFFLEVKGVRVASALCFDYGPARLLYNSGFDPEYSYYSVGLLLKALCLKEALEEGKEYFDFLRGSEPYKYDLGATDRLLYQLTVRRR
jgi:CelD/BcsL family acetyltransferase involved in cellulose biosynthesis